MTLKYTTAVGNLTGVAAEAAQMAVEAGLIYVSDAEPPSTLYRCLQEQSAP